VCVTNETNKCDGRRQRMSCKEVGARRVRQIKQHVHAHTHAHNLVDDEVEKRERNDKREKRDTKAAAAKRGGEERRGEE
jgi:hypothetical protein